MKKNIELSQSFKRQSRQLLSDISMLTLIINQETDMNVFLDFAGHVSSLRIYFTHDSDDYKWLVSSDIYLDPGDYRSEESVVDNLTRIKVNLKKIAVDKKIVYNDLCYSVREERDYHLH